MVIMCLVAARIIKRGGIEYVYFGKKYEKKFQHYWDYIIAAIITPLIWGWYYGDHFKLSLSYPLTNQSDFVDGFCINKSTH